MNPILRESIDTLTMIVNVNTGLEHPLDNTRAKELFIALHNHGVDLTANDVHSLALDNAWPDNRAKELAALAERIGAGEPVEIEDPDRWGEPTVRRIVSELEDP